MSFTNMEGPKAARSDIIEAADTIEQILDRHYPHWRERQDEWSLKNYEWAAIRQAAIRCKARIEKRDEVEQHLDPAPTIRASNLHPWVWEPAAPQWQTGHHAEAVVAAARSLNSHLQQRTDRRDLSDTKLAQATFSPKEPQEGEPRLRVPPNDGSETARSMQEGVLAFAVGCFKAIRNPLTHLDDDERELTEQQALERLAALSLLSYWTQTAELHYC